MHAHHFIYVFDPVLFLGVVGAVASVISAAFAALVWKVYRNQLATMIDALAETRASNELAARALELGRRAWLIPLIDERSPTTAHGGRRMIVRVSNTGGIPGIITSAGGAMKIGDPFNDEVSLTCHPTGQIVVPSRAAGEDPFLTFPVGDVTSQEENLRNGTVVLYAACRIEYTDAFQKQFSTDTKWFRAPDGKWYTRQTGSTFT